MQNIVRNREWRQIVPLPIPMKIVDKVYFQESYVVALLERIHYSYIPSLVVCAVGHRRGHFYSSVRKVYYFEGILLVEFPSSIPLPASSTWNCYLFCPADVAL